MQYSHAALPMADEGVEGVRSEDVIVTAWCEGETLWETAITVAAFFNPRLANGQLGPVGSVGIPACYP